MAAADVGVRDPTQQTVFIIIVVVLSLRNACQIYFGRMVQLHSYYERDLSSSMSRFLVLFILL